MEPTAAKKEFTTCKLIIKNLEGGGKHIFVKCDIYGHHHLMLLDTGCSNTVFDRSSEIFSQIKLHEIKGNNKNFSLNAPIDDVRIGKIKDFGIGKFTTDINRAVFISLEQVNMLYESLIGERIIGIVGSDFLTKHKATIDFGNKKLTIGK